MTDYTEKIAKNLGSLPRPDFLTDPQGKAEFNAMLERLRDAKLGGLVDDIARRKGHQVFDVLVEATLANHLLQNPNVHSLVHEPKDESAKPPDLRFLVGDVRFDVQVKHLHAIGNSQAKAAFYNAFNARALKANLDVPWFIDLSLTNAFQASESDGLFNHIRDGIKKRELSAGAWDEVTFAYTWPPAIGAIPKAYFSLRPAVNPESNTEKITHLTLGFSFTLGTALPARDGKLRVSPLMINQVIIRKALENKLDKASETLKRQPNAKQVNLVVLQAETHLAPFVEPEVIGNSLYGDRSVLCWPELGIKQPQRGWEKLFHQAKFNKMCGMIVLPASLSPLSPEFEGVYFPHPVNRGIIAQHPQPLPGIEMYRGSSPLLDIYSMPHGAVLAKVLPSGRLI